MLTDVCGTICNWGFIIFKLSGDGIPVPTPSLQTLTARYSILVKISEDYSVGDGEGGLAFQVERTAQAYPEAGQSTAGGNGWCRRCLYVSRNGECGEQGRRKT